jgi:hypothetical protein
MAGVVTLAAIPLANTSALDDVSEANPVVA